MGPQRVSLEDAAALRSGMEDAMHVTHDIEGQLVTLSGRLDVHSVSDVRAELQDAVDRGTGALVVDLAAVEVLDATGLGVLMGVHRRALRADRQLVLRSVPERLLRLLRATRLDRVLTVQDVVAVDMTLGEVAEV
jgi:anti-anti-sigma factor